MAGTLRPSIRHPRRAGLPTVRVSSGGIGSRVLPAVLFDSIPNESAIEPQVRQALKAPVGGRAAFSFRPPKLAIKAPLGGRAVSVFSPAPIHPVIRSPKVHGRPVGLQAGAPPAPQVRPATRSPVGGQPSALVRGAGIGGTVRGGVRAPLGGVPVDTIVVPPPVQQILPVIKAPVGARPVRTINLLPLPQVRRAVKAPVGARPAVVAQPATQVRPAIRSDVSGAPAALVRGAGVGGSIRDGVKAPVGGRVASYQRGPGSIRAAVRAPQTGRAAVLVPFVPPAADVQAVKVGRPTGRPVVLASPFTPPEHPHTDPKVESHCAAAIARVAQQFKEKPNLRAFWCTFAEEAQKVDQALSDVLAFRSIETALGAQLDRLGAELGLPREGVSDDTYRVRLRGQALVIGSKGTGDELLRIIVTLDDGFNPAPIRLQEFPGAAMIITYRVGAGQQLAGELYARMLKRGKAAGVQLVCQFFQDNKPLFSFSDSGSPFATGWAERIAKLPGGCWADAV